MRTLQQTLRAIAGVLLACAAIGCSQSGGELKLADRDFAQFKEQVFPVLMRDRAFHACHGDQRRFFRVWGSARARLLPSTKALSEVQPDEIMYSYTHALAMIDARDPGASLLLRKPLAPAAGGSGHLGTDRFGRNVYQTVRDPNYQKLAHWVFGK